VIGKEEEHTTHFDSHSSFRIYVETDLSGERERERRWRKSSRVSKDGKSSISNGERCLAGERQTLTHYSSYRAIYHEIMIPPASSQLTLTYSPLWHSTHFSASPLRVYRHLLFPDFQRGLFKKCETTLAKKEEGCRPWRNERAEWNAKSPNLWRCKCQKRIVSESLSHTPPTPFTPLLLTLPSGASSTNNLFKT